MGEVRDGKVRNSKKKRIQPIKNTKPTVEAPIQKPENIADKRINSPELLAELKGPNAHKLGFTMEKGAVMAPEYLRNAAYAVRDMKEKMPTGAVQQNQTGAPVSSPTSRLVMKQEAEDKPKTLSDYLSEQRKSLTKEKTDAAKMQKYYALTDALQAIGKMGGAAIGGAIGGNILDSAPVVAEYQPSRGYVSAFEDAKKANERLRALDEKGFQLAYNKQAREEERAYNRKMRAEEMAYKEKISELDKQWEKEMIDYKAKIEAAAYSDNLALKAKYEAEAAEKTQEYWKERAAITNASDMALKRVGQESMRMQNQMYNTTPIRFSDGSSAMIPDNYYESIKESLIGENIGGVTVTENNVGKVIRSNPKLVNEFLEGWGLTTDTNKKNTESDKSSQSDEVDHKYYSYNQQFGAYPEEAKQGGISFDVNAYIKQFE